MCHELVRANVCRACGFSFFCSERRLGESTYCLSKKKHLQLNKVHSRIEAHVCLFIGTHLLQIHSITLNIQVSVQLSMWTKRKTMLPVVSCGFEHVNIWKRQRWCLDKMVTGSFLFFFFFLISCHPWNLETRDALSKLENKQTNKQNSKVGIKVDGEWKRELQTRGKVKYRSAIDKHNRNFRCDVRGQHS